MQRSCCPLTLGEACSRLLQGCGGWGCPAARGLGAGALRGDLSPLFSTALAISGRKGRCRPVLLNGGKQCGKTSLTSDLVCPSCLTPVGVHKARARVCQEGFLSGHALVHLESSVQNQSKRPAHVWLEGERTAGSREENTWRASASIVLFLSVPKTVFSFHQAHHAND